MDKRRTAQDPPRVRLPELRLDTRALLAWAERAFRAPGEGAVARAPSPMSVHAAGLVDAWVRELGGPRQVTAQRVALLRMASYMVALADASWGAMQDGVLVEPRLLLEPVRHGAALLERAGLDRAARDVNAIRTSAARASGVAGWREARRRRSPRAHGDAALATEANASDEGLATDAGPVPEPAHMARPHPPDLAAPPPRATGGPPKRVNPPTYDASTHGSGITTPMPAAPMPPETRPGARKGAGYANGPRGRGFDPAPRAWPPRARPGAKPNAARRPAPGWAHDPGPPGHDPWPPVESTEDPLATEPGPEPGPMGALPDSATPGSSEVAQ